MRVLIPGLAAVAMAAGGSFAHAASFCDAVTRVSANATAGFTALRGPAHAAAHTSSFDVYKARVSLPGARACSIAAPEEAGLGPPSYACEFPSSAKPEAKMARLALEVARCVGAHIADPPPFTAGPQGPAFGFTAHAVRYDVSAARANGDAGPWIITVGVGLPAPGDR